MIKGCEIIIILENGIIFSPMQYSSDTPLGDDIHLNRNWSQSEENNVRPALLLVRLTANQPPSYLPMLRRHIAHHI